MRFIAASVCALILLAGTATTSFAQGAPKVEVSGGYNYLKVDDDTIGSMPGGWYADVAGNVTPMLAIVGQVTGNYEALEFDGISVDAKLHTFMGGVRVNARAAGGVTPFAQVLFGATRFSASSDGNGVLEFNVGDSESDAALQIGGGVKLMPKNVGVQLGADYIRAFTEGEGTNVFRFAAGVVIGF
jgi:hypothetical protein